MSKKIHVKTDDDIEVRYATWLKMLIDLMQPKNLYAVIGRGGAKTTGIIAERSQDVCYDMQGCYSAIIGNTYTNLLKNISPGIIEGWNRLGWKEGKHYVTDEPPPSFFKTPYKKPQTYQHTISTITGNFFNYISMDTPSSGAGNSYQHGFGDETKYLEKKRIDSLFPALRGESTIFGHSPYYLGVTFTTDHPNEILPGEYGWILDKEKEMNKQQIQYLLQISMELNEARIKLLTAKRKRNNRMIKMMENQVKKLAVMHTQLRLNSTFFYIASSLVNIDSLRFDFLETSLASVGEEVFNTSVLSFKPEVEAGSKFYVAFDDEKHLFEDGIVEDFLLQFNTGDDAELNSLALKYCNPILPLEIGLDVGKQISMVVAQRKGKELFVLKNFHVLAPKSSREIADELCYFFRYHSNKRIKLYNDPTADRYNGANGSWVKEIKFYIENNNIKGFEVEIINLGVATIPQQKEFLTAKAIMQEAHPDLPILKIDKYQCRELISSMNVATQIIKANDKGIRTIHKNKTSEKLPLHKLPTLSTNYSDAFKYLICRREWMEVLSDDNFGFSDPEILR